MAATVAGLLAYALARGQVVADDAATAAALVRAHDYITFHYVARFRDGFDDTSPNVDPAIYEAAMIELATPGFFNKSYTPDQQKVLTKVEGIQWTPISMSSSTGGSVAATPTSTKIEAMLRPYLEIRFGAFVV